MITPQSETKPPKEPTPPRTPPQSPKGSPIEEDPFEPPIRSPTPPPPLRSPTPPSSPSDVEMADDTSSSKGERGKMPKAFEGDRKKAKSFMIDMNLFFEQNEKKYDTPKSKILNTLSNIAGKAQQWKENMYQDLKDPDKPLPSLNDWEAFKTAFNNNWNEIDSPGQAMTEIYRLHRQKVSVAKYVQLFQELIRKARITEEAAIIPYFTQGLKHDILEKCLNRQPKDLTEWYEAAIGAEQNKTRLGILTSLSYGKKGGSSRYRDPDAMDVDAVMINALSKEEREKHVKEGLCFICHKSGHMSRECPMGKNSKGKFKKKFKGGKGKRRSTPGRHIRATSRDDDDDVLGEEEEEEESNQVDIRAMLKEMTPAERINLLSEIDSEDF